MSCICHLGSGQAICLIFQCKRSINGCFFDLKTPFSMPKKTLQQATVFRLITYNINQLACSDPISTQEETCPLYLNILWTRYVNWFSFTLFSDNYSASHHSAIRSY
jgi:hypothetical protein